LENKMTEEKKISFDYKDADSLRPFISENGKILSTRYTRLDAKQQRKLTKAVKRARILGIIPFTDKHKTESK
tara:strand:+ start:16323 stop:16538 length:216 start_codon:yes stop_codon:yes gene_type:complete